MKNIFFFISFLFILIVSCNKKAYVIQNELNGIWKPQYRLNDDTYIEIKDDTTCIWYNYQNVYRYKVFTLDYSENKSIVTLYDNKNRKKEQFAIRRNKKGKLLFYTNLVTGYNTDGTQEETTITYIKQ